MLKLPRRLDELLQRYGHMLPNGAEDEIPLIKGDLEKIIALLQKFEEDHAAAMVKCWTKEVRELSYDIEDFLDQYEHAAAGCLQEGEITRRRSPHHRIIRWRRSKTPYLPEKLRQRLWMANKIREFSERVQEALERHSMYNNLQACSTASCRNPDPCFGARHPTLAVDDVHNHVGIDVAINKLEEWLMATDGTMVHNLKVVSITGFAGVGKTNLANQLYNRLRQRFECRAFVRVSQKPDMRRIFITILSQVCPHQCPDNWKVHTLISIIRTHLQDKRYLIILDDLCATSTWEIIKSALPDGKSHSRILTTTDIEDLALHCCGYESKYVFNLKPLDEDDSIALFFSSIFGPPHECPLELREVSHDITRKCCGLPLAIVTIASILTDYLGRKEQWDYVNKSLGCSLMKIPRTERIKQILNLCYDNLPQCLKVCMLYTSIYEAGNIIQKDDLVNEWIAEGFIHATEGQDWKEISRGYFDELVRRKMIQPVDIKDSGEIISCMVHHIVLNLMMDKSIEENFVTAIHHSQVTAILADKVRRFSLHFGNAEDVMPPTNMRLSHVRTLAFFGVYKCMPSIVEFRLLQVLILHLWGDSNNTVPLDFTRISELFRLRYLKVACNVNIQLHIQMQPLQSLETLQIDARVTTLLSDNTHLPDLLHLHCPAEISLPNWIGHMTSLRTLGCIDLTTDSMENLQNLSMLTNLQDIRLTCRSTALETSSKNKMLDHLLTIMGTLGNLRSLITLVSKAFPHASSSDSADSQKRSFSNHGFSRVHIPAHIQRLEFSPRICIFSSLSNFIGQLHKLRFLKIGINKIIAGDIDILRRLPSLTILSLYVHTKLAERIVIGKDGFSVLKHFKLKSCDPWLIFEMDAMSNLQKLKLGFNARRGDQRTIMPVGMERLSGLKEVSVKIGGATSPEASDRRTAESAFRDAIRLHARCPRVTILYVNEIIGSMDDETSIKREENYARFSHMLPTKRDTSKLTEESTTEKDKMIQIVPCESSRAPVRKRKGSEPTKQLVTSNPNSDGFSWRKYGSTKHRNYYRCSSRPCNARKTVQRIDRDPPLFDVRYSGEHSCLQPKNSNDQRSGDEQPRATHSNDQESGATAATEAAEEEFPLPSTPPRC